MAVMSGLPPHNMISVEALGLGLSHAGALSAVTAGAPVYLAAAGDFHSGRNDIVQP